MRKSSARGSVRFDEVINAHYDRRMYDPLSHALYEGSDFHNLGYWTKGTTSLKQACENLMEKLLSFIPDKTGTIVDVACGKGATTRHLLRHWPAQAVAGVNISKTQLDTGRKNAPGARFVLSDAARLAVRDASFDNAICVEAAQDFNTREKWLYEAYRVLRPGGRLVFSDILLESWAERMFPARRGANYMRTIPEYVAMLRQIGFREVEVNDATEECSASHIRYVTRHLGLELGAGRIDRRTHNRMMAYLSMTLFVPRYYVLGWARRD
jgi:ubiquinone/menaquinone biosynthesis C-methylase UbiE